MLQVLCQGSIRSRDWLPRLAQISLTARPSLFPEGGLRWRRSMGGARLCAWTDGSMRWLCPSPGLSNFLSPRALNAAGPSLASASVDDVRVCLRFGERRRQGQSEEIGAASVPTRGVFGWWGCLARRRVVLDDQCRRRVGGHCKGSPSAFTCRGLAARGWGPVRSSRRGSEAL